MTDPELADRTYIEPVTPATVALIIEKERPDALLPTMGGQTALNVAMALHEDGTLAKYGVELIGANARAIAVAPLPLARRAVRRWLTGEHPPDAATVERVLAVARGEAVACELPGGDRVSRRNQRLSRNGPSEQD